MRDHRIACALDDAVEFAESCTIESAGDEVIVRHPDGGFRRFSRTPQTVTTDGADPAALEADGSVRIGRDRYRLPPQ